FSIPQYALHLGSHTFPTRRSSDLTEGSSLETIRHMVASGLGVSVLPLSAANSPYYSNNLLTTRPFTAPAPYRTVALAWRVTFPRDRKSTRLNSSHVKSSYAVFCLK